MSLHVSNNSQSSTSFLASFYGKAKKGANTASNTSASTNANNAKAANATGDAEDNSGVRSVNFNSMTRTELLNWLTQQIKTGSMSKVESKPFVTLTLATPEDGTDELLNPEGVSNDYFQQASNALQTAQSSGDQKQLEAIQQMLNTMTQSQGMTFGLEAKA